MIRAVTTEDARHGNRALPEMPHLARSVGMVANRVRDYDYEHDYEHEHVHENAAVECNGVGFIYGDLYVM